MSQNKNIFKILLLIIYLSLSLSSTVKTKPTFKELVDKYLGKLDINYAYLSYDQYINLLNTLTKDFPNYFVLSSIGKTYKGNEMPLLIMKSPFITGHERYNDSLNRDFSELSESDNFEYENNNNTESDKNNNKNINLINNSLDNQSGVLFDGMHHAREPVSMMMNIYLILHLLSLPRTYLHLFLSSTNIYFIPIINIDTYKYNSQKYLSGHHIRNVTARKNRRPHSTKKCKSDDDMGVDLNRNYDYFFGKDNEGSSGDPCQEDYRGEHPFSEPETLNIKNFVDSHPNIKIVYNYHSWGNLIITPFNYLKNEESRKKIKEEFPIHYKMYEDFKEEAKFPVNFLFGNGDNTIKYLANGDATDWFLGKKKILSFSPELGNGNRNSDVFYPDKQITFDVLEKNLYGGLYAIQKSMYFLKGELISANYNKCTNKNEYTYYNLFSNRGKIYQDRNNINENNIKNCFYDEVLLNVKAKIINKGFGDYIPGVEFPSFSQVNSNNNETIKNDVEKKYFYFLVLDLKVDIDKIKSICYWSTLQTLYSTEVNHDNSNQFIEDKNKAKKENKIEETQYIGKIRCEDVNKGNEINNMKLFIDNEIKSMEYIILNIQIIVKKDSFFQKLNKNTKRFLGLKNNDNNTKNNNTDSSNNNEFIKIYTKKERLIKSEAYNGEIIEWKFNDPTVNIRIEDFIEKKNNILNKDNIKVLMNPYKIIIIVICFSFILLFVICKIIKKLRGRTFHALLVESFNRNNNIDNVGFGMNNEQIVNNLENAGQNQNSNNDQIIPVQIPREDSEPHSNTNSNSDSPTELNPSS